MSEDRGDRGDGGDGEDREDGEDRVPVRSNDFSRYRVSWRQPSHAHRRRYFPCL